LPRNGLSLRGDFSNLLAYPFGQDNERTMSEQRRAKRTKMVLPVKVSIAGITHLAHTFDLTYVGARLGGLRAELKVGQVISLQRGSKKANFKVCWVQNLSPSEIQAGVQAVEVQNNFWGVDLSETDRDGKSNVEALMSLMATKSK
jgi:hypothetical protein